MRIGITGTRKGLSLWQKSVLRSELTRLSRQAGQPLQLHHGDCVGVDAQAHAIATRSRGQPQFGPLEQATSGLCANSRLVFLKKIGTKEKCLAMLTVWQCLLDSPGKGDIILRGVPLPT